MQTIDGRTFANRADLIAHSGYSRASLAALWKDRETNGHPQPVTLDGVMHWDLEVWDAWLAGHQRARRDQARPVKRSPGPDATPEEQQAWLDEELAPAEQARMLGLDRNIVARYRKYPPPGWPEPVRVETLPSGRVREYRTRAQLLAYHDQANRIGVAGRPAAQGPDPRVQIAAEALAAQPEKTAGELAVELAAAHGQSTATWKAVITKANQAAEAGRSSAYKRDAHVKVAAQALAAHPEKTGADLAAELAATQGLSVRTWKNIITLARKQNEG